MATKTTKVLEQEEDYRHTARMRMYGLAAYSNLPELITGDMYEDTFNLLLRTLDVTFSGVPTRNSPSYINGITAKREVRLMENIGVDEDIIQGRRSGKSFTHNSNIMGNVPYPQTPSQWALDRVSGLLSFGGVGYRPNGALPYSILRRRNDPSEVLLDSRMESMAYLGLNKWMTNTFTGDDTKRINVAELGYMGYRKRLESLRPRNGHLETIIFSYYYGCNPTPAVIDEAKRFSGFLRTMTMSETAHYQDNMLNTTKLKPSMRFSTHNTAYLNMSDYSKDFIKENSTRRWLNKYYAIAPKGYSYTLKDTDAMSKVLLLGLRNIPTSKEVPKEGTFTVLVSEFNKMSFNGKIILLDNLNCRIGKTLYINLNTIQDVSFLGRQYNSLCQLPSDDRKFIKNLKGYDMESAMQRIFTWLLRNTGLDISFYTKYVDDKHAVRAKLGELTGLDKDEIKTKLTAIGMGQSLRGEASAILNRETTIYKDRDTVFEFIRSLSGDTNEVAKYSRHRTLKSRKKKTKNPNYKITFSKMTPHDLSAFVLFYWTYYERKVQDVMSSMIDGALPLHDAVYTQGELPPMKAVEEMIEAETGIPMTLGIA